MPRGEPQKKLVYGLVVPITLHPAQIEMDFIRWGGYRKLRNGSTVGEGLFYHYKRLQQLLWPEDDHHRWSDLMLKEILDNTITAILGPKDSGKTHCALSKFGLTDYFCFPNNTLILISSTDIRGLEYRVWGDLKDLFQRAKEKIDWLPGHLIDSKHAICTQNLKDDEVRDMRKGIVCFVEGTQVDTPTGPKPIESLRVGDLVLNAVGVGRIKETQRRIAPQLVRVQLSDGRTIDCTPEHPFFTQKGWCQAIDLETYDRVFSINEILRDVWPPDGAGIPESKALFGNLSRLSTAASVSPLRQGIPTSQTESVEQRTLRTVLQHDLCEPLGRCPGLSLPPNNEAVCALRENDEARSSESGFLLNRLPGQSDGLAVRGMRQGVCVTSAVSGENENQILRAILQSEIEQPIDWRKASSPHAGRNSGKQDISTIGFTSSSLYCPKNEKEPQPLLRNRRGVSQAEIGCRTGRRTSFDCEEEDTRHQKDGGVEAAWVACVTLLESGGDERFNRSEGGYRVHNLSVAGHPSYSVNGVIVHNCIPCMTAGGGWLGLGKYVGMKQERRRLLSDECSVMKPAFMEAIANLNSGDFKGVFTGNPLGDGDPLDKISEPKGGWGTEGEITKTTVWENRFLGGHTINLVGTDSPNFDQTQDPNPRYPYMIHQQSIDNVAAFWTKDSLQYHSQCLGIRKSGLNAHRVITRRICEKFHALDPVYWRDTNQTRIYAIDAAYGNLGGDRCVGGYVEFGLDATNKMILNVTPPKIIPVSVKDSTLIPEDQIVEYAKADCSENNVRGDNLFYDSTGRGTLGSAFSRIWGANVNPVEFGGSPTPRPVDAGLYIFDEENKVRRLKRCDEHYIKFVTELWFSVRYIIEGGQMRGLPENVMEEGCFREWGTGTRGRIELETKTDTKDRMGRSPDLFDWLVTAVEGARRRGFIIARLEPADVDEPNDEWKIRLRDRAKKLRQSHELVYTT